MIYNFIEEILYFLNYSLKEMYKNYCSTFTVCSKIHNFLSTHDFGTHEHSCREKQVPRHIREFRTIRFRALVTSEVKQIGQAGTRKINDVYRQTDNLISQSVTVSSL